MARTSTSTPVTARAARAVTGGCLTALIILIVVLATALAWGVYSVHHADAGNARRRKQAQAEVAQQARHAASMTVQALTTKQADAGSVAAEDIVLSYGRDPDLGQGALPAKVTYDENTAQLTAVTLFSSSYEVEPALWGASDMESVTRCYALSFRYDSSAWHRRVTSRPDAACARRQAITDAAQAAQSSLSALHQTAETRARVQQILKPFSGATYDVITVSGQGHTVTVTALVHAPRDQQCYRFLRHTDSYGADAVTTTPIAAVHCHH